MLLNSFVKRFYWSDVRNYLCSFISSDKKLFERRLKQKRTLGEENVGDSVLVPRRAREVGHQLVDRVLRWRYQINRLQRRQRLSTLADIFHD